LYHTVQDDWTNNVSMNHYPVYTHSEVEKKVLAQQQISFQMRWILIIY